MTVDRPRNALTVGVHPVGQCAQRQADSPRHQGIVTSPQSRQLECMRVDSTRTSALNKHDAKNIMDSLCVSHADCKSACCSVCPYLLRDLPLSSFARPSGVSSMRRT